MLLRIFGTLTTQLIIFLYLSNTTTWLNNVSFEADSAFSTVSSLSTTLYSLSGVISTVSGWLANVSTNVSLALGDLLAVNLSITNASTQLYNIQNTLSDTVLPSKTH